jgi:hypothetical protein
LGEQLSGPGLLRVNLDAIVRPTRARSQPNQADCRRIWISAKSTRPPVKWLSS